jgi:hypothetical protein
MLPNSFGNLTFVHLIKVEKEFDMGQFDNLAHLKPLGQLIQ